MSAKPMTSFSARSLVGMTMGARKRAARRARQAAQALLARFGQEADPKKLALLRSIYRIGERLRPCLGCCACKSVKPRLRDIKRQYPVSARDMIARGTWVCGQLLLAKEAPAGPIHNPECHCDGSGVRRIDR